MKITNTGVENMLELRKHNQLRRYIPSSIAAFGPTENTIDLTIFQLQLLGEYYHKQYDVDFRSLRYPRIIRFAIDVYI